MKKILIFVLFCLFSFSLVSCSLIDSLKNEEPEEDGGNTDSGTGEKYDKIEIGKDYYNDLFDLNNVVNISIEISDDELKKINDSIYYDAYRKADKVTITITKPDGTVIEESIEEVGIRMKGNTTRREFFDSGDIYCNVHFKLAFDETFDDTKLYRSNEIKKWKNQAERDQRDDRTFFGLKKLELKWNREEDRTYSRDIYISKVYQSLGIKAQNTTLGVLSFPNQTFEGEKKPMGVYKVYEPIDKTFVKRYFGKNNKDGDLYKASYGSNVGMPTLNNTSSRGYGVDESVYHNQKAVTYALKTNKSSSDQVNIKNFLHWINSNNDLNDSLADFMDEEYFITFLAIQYLSGDWDNFMYDSNNYYFYFDNSGKCYFIPYDMDRTFGLQAKEHDMVNKRPLDAWNLQGSNNISNLLQRTIYVSGSKLQNAYLAKINEIAETVLNEEKFLEVYNLVNQNYLTYADIIYSDGGGDSPNNAVTSYFTQKLNLLK